MTEVQRWPSRHTLDYLKECLAYSNTSWVALFCRLGGAGLLLEVGRWEALLSSALQDSISCRLIGARSPVESGCCSVALKVHLWSRNPAAWAGLACCWR